jgi:Fe-S cluster assembly protein SufD
MTTTLTEPRHPSQFMRHSRTPEVSEVLLSAFEAIPEQPTASVLRSAAWKAFSSLGLPRSGDEEYSFVSANELQALLSRIPQADSAAGFEIDDAVGLEQFSLSSLTATSVPVPEALLHPWKNIAQEEQDAPAALAMALASNPKALSLKAGTRLEKPLSVVCRGSNGIKGINTRTDAALFFQLEAGSAAKVSLSSIISGSEGFLNASAVFRLGADAELDLTQTDPAAGMQTLKLRFILERGAKLRLVCASTGSRFQRLALEVDLMDSHAEADIRSAAVVGASNRCHRHVMLRHHAPDCSSRQLFKAVVLGAGRSSVDGTVVVDRNAQHTDARQLLQYLMLSKEGRADCKPRLLIHADDVKCSHGAAVGKMSSEQLFYLLSRGLDLKSARELLTQAFLAEALNASPLAEVREPMRARLMAALKEAS